MRLKSDLQSEGPRGVLLVLICPMTTPRLSWSCPWTIPRTYLSLPYYFLGRDSPSIRDPGSKMSWSLSWTHLYAQEQLQEELQEQLQEYDVERSVASHLWGLTQRSGSLTRLASDLVRHTKSTIIWYISTFVWYITRQLTTTSKKSIIGRALARFFCGLLIGSNVGVNAKWISTIKNVIADKILRLKTTNLEPSSLPTYNYANLQQEHEELKACSFFQPSPKLVLLLWEIMLTRKCQDLSLILSLKPQDLGRLCT